MWLEAIFSKEDLVQAIAQLTPLRIRLDGGGDLSVFEASEVTLVADAGLRVVCKAKLHWPVLGFKVPVTLHSVQVLVRPHIMKEDGHDQLVFPVEIEHADFAGLPDSIDARVTETVNQALLRKHVELKWDFASTLSHVFALPASLEQLRAIGLEVVWGEVRITTESLGLAVAFRAQVLRDAEAPPVTAETANAP
jgi:hypothetical protein